MKFFIMATLLILVSCAHPIARTSSTASLVDCIRYRTSVKGTSIYECSLDNKFIYFMSVDKIGKTKIYFK